MLPSGSDFVRRVKWRDAGHGYDEFGLHPPTAKWGLRALGPVYKHYFRVKSHGGEHIPQDGPAVIAANHAGMLPLDAIMLHLDVVANTDPPRWPRPAMDMFVPLMPWVGTFFQRCGAVAGSRGNFRRLLESGEILLAFPEGVPGIAKPIWKRYQLQQWRVGHCELAIRHSAPVIPAAIIGSEEQWPQLGRIDGIKLFGAPYLPIPATPLPLPVRYRIYYGEPIPLHEEHSPEEGDDPNVVAAAAARVKDAVAALIERGLADRKGKGWFA
jgi:1-acyl-sn-glycerol-3-phosphate acyltransferase